MAKSFLSWKTPVSHDNFIILIKSMSNSSTQTLKNTLYKSKQTLHNFLFKGRKSDAQTW